jgi:aspartyl-tRNA(Asn)/glutamyl-tRNA(Gln) amidotransferase subunit A
MNPEALSQLSARKLAAAIARGETTSLEATQACLARIAALDKKLNSFMRVDAERALRTARERDDEIARGLLRGKLHGVPLAHKDMFDRAGYVSTGGSRILADRVATATASVLKRLDAAGAVELGTLHMSEFAAGPTGHNVHYGPCRNAFRHDHMSGGSSSGAAAAVAARFIYGAPGSDTGGSIRLPAAANGLTGLKPTYGRVSRHGALPRSWSLDHVGPLARDARDAALIYEAIAGTDDLDSTTANQPVPGRIDFDEHRRGERLRIAFPTDDALTSVDPRVRSAIEETLRTYGDTGARIVRIALPDMQPLYATAETIIKAEAAAMHREWLRARPQDYAAHVRVRIEAGLAIPASQYIDALRLRPLLTRDFIAAAFGEADALLLPAIPIPVPTIEETDAEDADGERVLAIVGRITSFTRPISLLGLPALTAPCGFCDRGLPIAFQLVGKPFDEERLLKTADAFQQATDFHLRHPDIARAT